MRWPELVLIVLLAVTGGGAVADLFTGDPRISAQGFSADTPLRGDAGRFRPVRVRVEAPSRIAQLLISYDDVETDLANTPDRSLFVLFGLQRRPMNAVDVTLDFAPYINSHLTKPATYRIGITVVDRNGRAARSTVTLIVAGNQGAVPDADQQSLPPTRLQESAMTLRRQGAGAVEPVTTSPLTWTTREAVDVVVRLRASNPDAELRQLRASSWNDLLTRESLRQHIGGIPPVAYVDVPAARNGAAGTVVAINGSDGASVLHLTGSTTSISALGTTVTLMASVRRDRD